MEMLTQVYPTAQHFRRMMLGVSSQFMQQVGGCNAVSDNVHKFPCEVALTDRVY